MTTDLLPAMAPVRRSPAEGVSTPSPADAPFGTADGLIIVGSPHRQVETTAPRAALDLYDGGCVPLLRQRIGTSPAHRARVLFLSGRHGLVGADTPLRPYCAPMTADRVRNYRDDSASRLLPHLRAHPATAALLLLEHGHLAALPPMTHLVDRVCHFTDPLAHWPAVAAVLDSWGWP